MEQQEAKDEAVEEQIYRFRVRKKKLRSDQKTTTTWVQKMRATNTMRHNNTNGVQEKLAELVLKLYLSRQYKLKSLFVRCFIRDW